jgi:cytidyltransferase-like protein
MKPAQRKEKVIVMVSGGFDPVHIGHVRLFQEAKKLGDELVVVINNDNWLRTKKGFAFMPEGDRKEIIESLRPVDRVIITNHAPGTKDSSVCVALEQLQPNIFANGGDRHAHNIPEYEICNKLNITMVFNVGAGGKLRSSSELVKKAKSKVTK